jgi:O-methyltransferase
MDGINALNYILDNNIEGVIVECGVESGDFEYLWIEQLKKRNQIRDIYMYDTFNGLTEPGEYDYTANTAVLYKMDANEVYNEWKKHQINEITNTCCYCPLENVKKRLNETNYPQEHLFYIKGDVLDTLKIKENLPDKIAILRLDTDWYKSSLFELEMLYDRVVENGVIIFDDYYHWNGQKRATDEFFISRNLNYIIHPVYNGKTGTIIKQENKF